MSLSEPERGSRCPKGLGWGACGWVCVSVWGACTEVCAHLKALSVSSSLGVSVSLWLVYAPVCFCPRLSRLSRLCPSVPMSHASPICLLQPRPSRWPRCCGPSLIPLSPCVREGSCRAPCGLLLSWSVVWGKLRGSQGWAHHPPLAVGPTEGRGGTGCVWFGTGRVTAGPHGWAPYLGLALPWAQPAWDPHPEGSWVQELSELAQPRWMPE